MSEVKGHNARAVLQGVALLDDKLGPLWDQLINLDTLNMSSPSRCILGQTHGEYWDALDRFGINDPDQLGFDNDWDTAGPEMLDRLWTYVITARRAARNEN